VQERKSESVIFTQIWRECYNIVSFIVFKDNMSAKNDKAKGKSKQIESTHVSDLSIVSVIQYFF
jgi:hypothetical protein